jgi:crossover junction endodeoxyribonuclease RuvC
MKVLGIDPGTARVGWGVVEEVNGNLKSEEFGTIETSAKRKLENRLEEIFHQVSDIIKKTSPDIVAIEEIFYCKNQKTVIAVSQARGVIILAAAMREIEISEHTPMQVKEAVVGYGRAEKNQVQEMVKAILKLETIPRLDDTADALAVAICCINSAKLTNLIGK